MSKDVFDFRVNNLGFCPLQVFTQLNIEWGFSPVGRITPREWRE